jgi:hypothetical protein
MNSFPQISQLLEVLRRGVEYLSYLGPLRIAWPDRVFAICQGNIPIIPEIDNRLRLSAKNMHMARRMIVGIHDELNAVERQRSHLKIIT